MGIKQLNGTYVLAEDRILLRVTTDAGEEFRLWMTWPITGQLLATIRAAATRAIAEKLSPQVAQAVAKFEQEAIQTQTRFDDEFLAGATLPLGEVPALVVKLTAAEKADGLSLDLTLSSGKNVNLRLPRHIAQQFGVLLDGIQQSAGWGLAQPGAHVPAAGDAAATAASHEKKLMH